MAPKLATVGLVALLVLLSGCTGGLPGGAPDGSPSGDSTGGDGGDGDGGDGDEALVTWERFAFEPGEYYRFEVTQPDEDPEYVTWEVLAVDGSDVTIEVTVERDGETTSQTVTGQNATVVTKLQDVRAMGYLVMGPFNAMTAYFASRDFAPGNSWRLAGSERTGYLTAEVEGTDSYAGKECYVAAVRSPDNEHWKDDRYDWEFCIAPDVGLALHTAYRDGETGELTGSVTLVEYRPGGA